MASSSEPGDVWIDNEERRIQGLIASIELKMDDLTRSVERLHMLLECIRASR